VSFKLSLARNSIEFFIRNFSKKTLQESLVSSTFGNPPEKNWADSKSQNSKKLRLIAKVTFFLVIEKKKHLVIDLKKGELKRKIFRLGKKLSYKFLSIFIR